MNATMHQDPRIAAAAERQMQTWARLQEIAARADKATEAQSRLGSAVCYLTLSREAGAEGATIAQLVGERLRWEVYDKNVLDQVAHRYKESRLMLDLVDETPSDWIYDVLGTWMDHHVIGHDKCVTQVNRMIQILARPGGAVFVGRGAQFLLPKEKTFAVRVVAPTDYRAERIVQRNNVTLDEALREIRRVDRGRREYVQRHFQKNIEDPHLYDMVLNVEQLGVMGAAEQIVFAIRRAQSAVLTGGENVSLTPAKSASA